MLMTTREIAEHLGVKKATVNQWRFWHLRGDAPFQSMPQPAKRVGTYMLWDVAEMEAWSAKRRGPTGWRRMQVDEQ
jgi:hypothetical protein